MWNEEKSKFENTVYVVADGRDFSIIRKDISNGLAEGLSCVGYDFYPARVLRRYFLLKGLKDVSVKEAE